MLLLTITTPGNGYDRTRDAFLERAGIRVLRFENREVIQNLDGVLTEIAKHFR